MRRQGGGGLCVTEQMGRGSVYACALSRRIVQAAMGRVVRVATLTDPGTHKRTPSGRTEPLADNCGAVYACVTGIRAREVKARASSRRPSGTHKQTPSLTSRQAIVLVGKAVGAWARVLSSPRGAERDRALPRPAHN